MASLLQSLNDDIAKGSSKARTRALWHICDLLIAGRYAEEEIWTLGEVIERLTEEIQDNVRAGLAERLAQTNNAPKQTIRSLALNKSIAVAGKVLQHSERIDVATLKDCARTQSQAHLLAISKRRSLPESVTDILVQRGERPVARSVVANAGARLSEQSILHLISRSEGDTILAKALGARQDIPRHLFQQAIAKASEQAQARLASAFGDEISGLNAIVADAAGELHAKFGPASANYFEAKRQIAAKHRQGELTEESIRDYAEAHKFEKVIASLALLCSLPANVVERALSDRNRDLALILARSIDFSWETAMAILFSAAPDYRIRAAEVDELKTNYLRLDVVTARTVLQQYQERKPGTKQNRLSQKTTV